jgi:hypothetical protein
MGCGPMESWGGVLDERLNVIKPFGFKNELRVLSKVCYGAPFHKP